MLMPHLSLRLRAAENHRPGLPVKVLMPCNRAVNMLTEAVWEESDQIADGGRRGRQYYIPGFY
jgi:hypothetical protein